MVKKFWDRRWSRNRSCSWTRSRDRRLSEDIWASAPDLNYGARTQSDGEAASNYYNRNDASSYYDKNSEPGHYTKNKGYSPIFFYKRSHLLFTPISHALHGDS